MDDFNLSALVRTTLRASARPDPADVAQEVFAAIAPEHYPAALRAALRVYVQQMAARTRYHTHTAPTVFPPGDQAGHGAHGTYVPGRDPSWRVTAHRERWRQLLDGRVSLDTRCRDWRHLGECTANDLKLGAEIRQVMADKDLARARQYLELRSALLTHRVTTVRELPDAVLEPLMTAMIAA